MPMDRQRYPAKNADSTVQLILVCTKKIITAAYSKNYDFETFMIQLPLQTLRDLMSPTITDRYLTVQPLHNSC